MNNRIVATAVFLLAAASPAIAASEQASEVALLRNTVQNLLQAMVDEGLISREAAQRLIDDAETKANAEIAAMEAEQAVQEGDVRVTYVPQTVVDEISADVSSTIGNDVTEQVIARAEEEGWGIPGALPEWTRKLRLTGDVRVRSSPFLYAEDNDPRAIPNWQRINTNGGARGLTEDEQFINSSEDFTNYNLRLRFGVDVNLSDTSFIGIKFATENADIDGTGIPVSRNVNLGSYNNGFGFIVDEAYLRLNTGSDRRRNHFTLFAGRTPNIWKTTPLTFDWDVRLNGASIGYDYANRYGTGRPRGPFVTAGAYLLQNNDSRLEEFGVKDKWLYAGQAGWEFGLDGRGSKISIAGAYYHFDNIEGVKDPVLGARRTDRSVPGYLRKGNTLFGVRTVADEQDQIFGYASEFQVVNANLMATWMYRPDFQLDFIVDWVRNIGYDQQDVADRTGLPFEEVSEETDGYRVELQLGNPKPRKLGAWSLFGGWQYLERDAVVDGFAESDFLLGGTNYEGYFVGGRLGLADGIWFRGRLLSFDELTGPRLGIDIYQLDLNARF